MLVEFNPRVHLIPTDIADYVIDVQESGVPRDPVRACHSNEAGEKDSTVGTPFNKRVNSVTVDLDGRASSRAVVVSEHTRSLQADRTAYCGFLPCPFRVFYRECNRLNSVPVSRNVLGNVTRWI